MTAPTTATLAEALGEPVARVRRSGGGDINDAYRVTLASRREVFVKTRVDAPPGMYAREADGLRWLAAAKALRVPEVLAVCDAFLALAWVEPGPRASDFDEQLGRGLAQLHRARAPHFGLDVDNFIGNLPQPNAPCASWSGFYRTRRLEPLVARARAAGLLSGEHTRLFEQLYGKLDALVGAAEPPARLHGDLWSGNVHGDTAGAPVLIDPAVYGGHREIDLAMLALFGRPSARFFAAYDEVYPRSPGHAERVALNQLYPLLVHVNLFGHAYVGQLRTALAQYV